MSFFEDNYCSYHEARAMEKEIDRLREDRDHLQKHTQTMALRIAKLYRELEETKKEGLESKRAIAQANYALCGELSWGGVWPNADPKLLLDAVSSLLRGMHYNIEPDWLTEEQLELIK